MRHPIITVAVAATISILSTPASAGQCTGTLEEKVDCLNQKLQILSFDPVGEFGVSTIQIDGGLTVTGGPIFADGANVYVANSAGPEEGDGTGNVVIGFPFSGEGVTGSGSHNLVIGQPNSVPGNYNLLVGSDLITWGNYGVAFGRYNEIHGDYSTVLGGHHNIAESADFCSVVGGSNNKAIGPYSAIVGGQANVTVADYSFIAGGQMNRTDYEAFFSSVVGGQENMTVAPYSSVFGGQGHTAEDDFDVWAGELFADQ